MPNRQALITRLEATQRGTLALFDTHPDALAKSYAPGKWTVRDLLVHISDAETVLLDRLRRIAAEPNPPLAAFDQDRWAKELFYSTRDLNLARMQFEAARRSVIELAANLPESVDEKFGTHSEAGPLTFATVLEKVANHNDHHLEQIRCAVAGEVWTKKS